MPKFIIFDTETTGLEEEDRIIQVGAIVIDKNRELVGKGVYNELCSTTPKIKIEAMATHGIRQEYLEEKPLFLHTEFYTALNELNSEKNYLIAHNLPFDFKMLKKEGFVSKFKEIDTLRCAKHVYEVDEEINGYGLPNHKLQTFRYILLSEKEEKELAKKLECEIKAHDAIGDVIILRLFMGKLLSRVSKKYQIDNKNIVDLMDKMVELTLTPVLYTRPMKFGKYKGETLTKIASTGKGKEYLSWMLANMENLDEDMKYSIAKALEA